MEAEGYGKVKVGIKNSHQPAIRAGFIILKHGAVGIEELMIFNKSYL
jgi:hypothetical protein